jgi:hypothetical protein
MQPGVRSDLRAGQGPTPPPPTRSDWGRASHSLAMGPPLVQRHEKRRGAARAHRQKIAVPLGFHKILALPIWRGAEARGPACSTVTDHAATATATSSPTRRSPHRRLAPSSLSISLNDMKVVYPTSLSLPISFCSCILSL